LTAPTACELERPCPLRGESAIRYGGETGAGQAKAEAVKSD